MRKNLLKSKLAAGEPALNAWLNLSSALIAEAATQGGFDAVTVDMQHGMMDYAQAIAMLQAISIGPATPLARPSSSDPVQIMHLLDAGAYGVICPQVDTPESSMRGRVQVSSRRRPICWCSTRPAVRGAGLHGESQ